jgi:hypothetical protein
MQRLTWLKKLTTKRQISNAYADCPDFQKVYEIISALKAGKTHDTWPDYSINEAGLLLHRDSDTHQVCVPSSQRNLILRVMHDLPLGMQQATAKMYGLMSSRFYFPKMAERVKAYVESCEHCQRNKAYTRNTRGVPRPSDVPSRRFDVVALHIVSGFSATKNGFDAIVVFTDRLTQRVYIEPCTETASVRDSALIFFRTVAASLMRDMIIGIHSWFISNSRYFYRQHFHWLLSFHLAIRTGPSCSMGLCAGGGWKKRFC